VESEGKGDIRQNGPRAHIRYRTGKYGHRWRASVLANSLSRTRHGRKESSEQAQKSSRKTGCRAQKPPIRRARKTDLGEGRGEHVKHLG